MRPVNAEPYRIQTYAFSETRRWGLNHQQEVSKRSPLLRTKLNSSVQRWAERYLQLAEAWL